MLMALAGAWFGFANPILHLPPAILLLPAALILTAGRATGPGQAFRTGMLNSLPAYAASLYWLAVPVHDYGGLPWIVALPCPVLVGGVLAAYAGLFCLGLYLIRLRLSHPLAGPLAGLLWASLELARNHFLTGFSWLTLSQSLSPWPWALGLAAWIGAFGLSGALVAMTHFLVRGPGWTRLAALPLAGLCLLPGLLRGPVTSESTVSVSMIQGNIDQGLKWDEAMQAAILKTYVDLSTTAVRQTGPDLVVWPETAMPFYFQDPSDLSRTVRQTARDMGTPLLAGAPAYSVPPDPGGPEYALHNRAYLLDGAGQAMGWYDKEHLVPFGEYVPLSRWLPFMTKLVPGEYEFRPGVTTTTLKTGPLSMGLLICYEAIFPELAQKQVALGANVLVNISNDAWFGRTSAPWQHLHLSVLRAVEQNRTIIRATNTGISVFIGPDGSLSNPSPLFTPGIVHNDAVPLLTETTFYHEHFHLIHAAFPLLSLALLAFLTRNRRVKP
jgi:apolipoprotein N-acyltransferase